MTPGFTILGTMVEVITHGTTTIHGWTPGITILIIMVPHTPMPTLALVQDMTEE